MFGNSQHTQAAADVAQTTVPYADAGVSTTFAKEPFHTLLSTADVDGETGRRLNRGHLAALCGGDPAQRNNPERLEYFDPPSSSSSSGLLSSSSAVFGGATPSGNRAHSKVPLQVETFSRSSAGKEIAEPGRTRSPAALSKAMHFLVEHYIRAPHTPLVFTDPNMVWGYLWDRFRGIRTTWIPQLPTPTSLETLERVCASPRTAYVDAATDAPIAARTLADETRQLAQWLEFTVASLSFAAAYMCRTPAGCAHFAVYNKKNFVESMSQCFTTLAVWYRAEARLRHAEFISLLLILYGFQQGDKAEDRAAFCRFYSATDMSTGEELWYAESAAESVNMARVYAEIEKQPMLMDTPAVRRVLRLLQCWAQRNWLEFFRLCREEEAFLTPLQKAFLFQSFTYARFRAVLDLVLPDYSVYAKMRVRGAMQVRALAQMLLMEYEHCIRFLRTMGLGSSLVKATKSEMRTGGEVQCVSLSPAGTGGAGGDEEEEPAEAEEGEWWLRLCDAATNPIALSVHLKEQCEKHKTDLFFPTYPEYFGFRVWHEAYDRFGAEAGFPAAGTGNTNRTDEYDNNDDDYDDDEEDDANSDAYGDEHTGGSAGEEDEESQNEDDYYDDEYFNDDDADAPRKKKTKKQKAARVSVKRVQSGTAGGTTATTDDAALLRMEGCPINLSEVLEPYCPPYTPAMAGLTLHDVPEVFFASIPQHRRERLWTHVLSSTFERHTAASLPLYETMRRAPSSSDCFGGAVLPEYSTRPEALSLLEAHKDELLDRLDRRFPISSGFPSRETGAGAGSNNNNNNAEREEDGDSDDDEDSLSIASDLTDREDIEAVEGPYVASLHRRDGAFSLTDHTHDGSGAMAASHDEAHADAAEEGTSSSPDVLPVIRETDDLLASITQSTHYRVYALTREEAAARDVIQRDETGARRDLPVLTPPPPPRSAVDAAAPFPAQPVLALPAVGKTTVAPLPDDYVSKSSPASMPCIVESPKTPAPQSVTPATEVPRISEEGEEAAAAISAHGSRREASVEDVQPVKAAASFTELAAARLPRLAFNTTMPATTESVRPMKRTRAEAHATDVEADAEAKGQASGAGAAAAEEGEMSLSSPLTSLATDPALPLKRACAEVFPPSPPSSVEASTGNSASASEDGDARTSSSPSAVIGFSHHKPPAAAAVVNTPTPASHTAAAPTAQQQQQQQQQDKTRVDWSAQSAAVAVLGSRGAVEEVSSWQRLSRTGTAQHARTAAAAVTSAFFGQTIAPLVQQYLTEAAALLWLGAGQLAPVQDALASALLNADMSEGDLAEWYARLYPQDSRDAPDAPTSGSLRHQLRRREQLARRLCCGFSPALVAEYEWVAAEVDRLGATPCTDSQDVTDNTVAGLLHTLSTRLTVPLAPTSAASGLLEALSKSLASGHSQQHRESVRSWGLSEDRYAAFTRLIRTHGYAVCADPTTGAATIWDRPQSSQDRRQERIREMDARHVQLTATFLLASTSSSRAVDVVAEDARERQRERAGPTDPRIEAADVAQRVLSRLCTSPLERCVASLLSRLPSDTTDTTTASAADEAAEDPILTSLRACGHNSRAVTWCTPVQDEVDTLRDQYAELRVPRATQASPDDMVTSRDDDDASLSLRFGTFQASGEAESLITCATLQSPLVAQLGVLDSRHRLQRHPSKRRSAQPVLLDVASCVRVYGCASEELNRFVIQRDGRLRWIDGETEEQQEDDELMRTNEESADDAAADGLSSPATGAPQVSTLLCLDQRELTTPDAAQTGLAVLRRLGRRAGRHCHTRGQLRGEVLSGVLVLLVCDPAHVEAATAKVQQLFWDAFEDGKKAAEAAAERASSSSSPHLHVSGSVVPPPLLAIQPLPTVPHTACPPVPWVQDALYQGLQTLLQAYAQRLQGVVEELTQESPSSATHTSPRGTSDAPKPIPPSSFSSRAFATLA